MQIQVLSDVLESLRLVHSHSMVSNGLVKVRSLLEVLEVETVVLVLEVCDLDFVAFQFKGASHEWKEEH
jgi:hypothetical protein